MATKLTANFTLEELVASSTADAKGINNNPSSVIKAELLKLAKLLQKVRDKYGKPIIVTSGYRCAALNKAVGGSATSQHMKGQAADIKAADGDHAALFNVIKTMIQKKELTCGQLIWEYGNKSQPNWVHLSIPYTKVNNILYLYSK